MDHDREFEEIAQRLRDEDPFLVARTRLVSVRPPQAATRVAAVVVVLVIGVLVAVTTGMVVAGAGLFLAAVLIIERILNPRPTPMAHPRAPRTDPARRPGT